MSKNLKDFTFEKVHEALENSEPNVLRRWLFSVRHQLLDQLEETSETIDRMFVVIPTLIAKGAIVYAEPALFRDAVATLHFVYRTPLDRGENHADEAARNAKTALHRLHDIGGTLVEYRRFEWFEDLDIATPENKSWVSSNKSPDADANVSEFQLLWLLSSPTVPGSSIDHLPVVSSKTTFGRLYNAAEIFLALDVSRAELLTRVQHLQDGTSNFLDDFDKSKLVSW